MVSGRNFLPRTSVTGQFSRILGWIPKRNPFTFSRRRARLPETFGQSRERLPTGWATDSATFITIRRRRGPVAIDLDDLGGAVVYEPESLVIAGPADAVAGTQSDPPGNMARDSRLCEGTYIEYLTESNSGVLYGISGARPDRRHHLTAYSKPFKEKAYIYGVVLRRYG